MSGGGDAGDLGLVLATGKRTALADDDLAD